jgi:hypothetical protein
MFLTTKQAANRTKGKSPARAMKRARDASSVATAKAAKAATLSMQSAASAIQSKRAQAAAQQAAAAAQAAAHNASDAAQAAAVSVRKGVGTGIHGARSWAAPRLEDAADYTTKTAAPMVSSALRKTARQVKPPKGHSKRSVLGWTAFGAALLAAIGAGAVLVRYRYRTAITADGEQTPSDRPGSKADARPDESASPADANADTSVNGRVTSSQW